MIVEFGPPGATGVGTLQYLSGDPLDAVSTRDIARQVGLAATAVWAWALVTKRRRARRTAFWVACGAWAYELLQRR